MRLAGYEYRYEEPLKSAPIFGVCIADPERQYIIVPNTEQVFCLPRLPVEDGIPVSDWHIIDDMPEMVAFARILRAINWLPDDPDGKIAFDPKNELDNLEKYLYLSE